MTSSARWSNDASVGGVERLRDMPQADFIGVETLIERRETIAERLAEIEKEGVRLNIEDDVLRKLLNGYERIEVKENGTDSL